MNRILLCILMIGMSFVQAGAVERLELEVISYEDLIQSDSETLQVLDKALHEKGIVGIRGVPGYREKYEQFIKAAREFSALSEDTKEHYKPNRGLCDAPLGYEASKERFQRPDGTWVIDDLKTSYYAFIPDTSLNQWPLEVNLREPFEDLGELMADTGEMVMHKIGLLGSATGIELETNSRLGRMLHYRKSDNNDNPYCCGAHFDHGLFTVILPAVYFANGEQVSEPLEAGLFVRTSKDEPYKKVFAEDLDVMMFQVGEFGQLITNDGIRATEHRVHKAADAIERYTLAVFYNAPMDTPIYSQSILTSDARYGAKAGEPSTYRHWNKASFQRYLVEEE